MKSRQQPVVTILTHASFHPLDRLRQRASLLARGEFRRSLTLNDRRNAEGPTAVTRSLRHGLEQLGVPYVYNPSKVEDMAPTVIVLSHLRALRRAIHLKEEGKIKRLLAGPNLVVLPSDAPIVSHPLIDLYLVNSAWTKEIYLADSPALKGHCEIWFAGVDTKVWAPSPESNANQEVLIYSKRAPDALLRAALKACEARNLKPSVLYYGRYTHEQYLKQLRQSQLAIFLSHSESQGLALVEAWSTDVPTLVWNPGFMKYQGQRIDASSAPYLTEHTGRFFSDESELHSKLELMTKQLETFSPRDWALRHLSDELSARRFCELAQIGGLQ